MSNHDDKCNCCMCPPGPQGPAGPQGIPGRDGMTGSQGPVGSTGATGHEGPQGNPGQSGTDGIQGPQGLQGLTGAEGPIGPQGPKGDSCEPCKNEFAAVYSVIAQTLIESPGINLTGGVATFENTIVATSGIDVSMAASTGLITVKVAGWYDVASGICGALNPLPSPLPCWTVSLFRNGVIVAGSTFSNQAVSPEEQSNEITADVYMLFAAGDTLQLASTSTNKVILSSPTLGTNAAVNSCYVKLNLLQAA